MKDGKLIMYQLGCMDPMDKVVTTRTETQRGAVVPGTKPPQFLGSCEAPFPRVRHLVFPSAVIGCGLLASSHK